MNVKLSEENRKIKQELISNFKDIRLTTDLNKDIVNLIAEMTTQALQMSQETQKDEQN
jgi:hypothetical protein